MVCYQTGARGAAIRPLRYADVYKSRSGEYNVAFYEGKNSKALVRPLSKQGWDLLGLWKQWSLLSPGKRN